MSDTLKIIFVFTLYLVQSVCSDQIIFITVNLRYTKYYKIYYVIKCIKIHVDILQSPSFISLQTAELDTSTALRFPPQ